MLFPEGSLVAGLFLPVEGGRAQRVQLWVKQRDPDGTYRVPIKTLDAGGESRVTGYSIISVKIVPVGKPEIAKLSLDQMWEGWDQLTIEDSGKLPWIAGWLPK